MWIEILQEKKKFLLNSDLISGVFADNDAYKVNLPFISGGGVFFYFDDRNKRDAFIEGFKLALNGLDFVTEDCYIKPLFKSKNEALYRYMMLKEIQASEIL